MGTERAPLGLGIAGAGRIATHRVIPAVTATPGLYLAAVFQRPASARDSGAGPPERAGLPPGVTSHQDIGALANDDTVDVVYIASPPAAHEHEALASLSAGKPVLIEKPLALDIAALDRILAAAQPRELLVDGAFMMRFHPLHRRAREIIRTRQLGAVRLVRATFCIDYPRTPGAWRYDPAVSGGGAFADLGVHLLDLIDYLFDGSSRVIAFSSQATPPGVGESWATATLLVGPDRAPCLLSAHFDLPESHAPSRIEIAGTGGTMVLDRTIGQESTGSLLVRSDRSAFTEIADAIDLYAAELDQFLTDLSSPERRPQAADRLRRVQRLLDACYRCQDIEREQCP